MANRNNRKLRSKTYLSFGQLEPRQYLTSVGWDGPGTGSAVLTYHVGPAPEGVDQETFEEVIEEALGVWSSVADVYFLKADEAGLERSLDFTFAELDGQGGMLANAFFPDDVNPEPYAGDVQFDLSESWEIGNSHGEEAYDLLYVAVHEIGHALGLEHLGEDHAIMNSLVEPNDQFRRLTRPDVDAIHQLYGRAGGGGGPDDPVRDPGVRPKFDLELTLFRESQGRNTDVDPDRYQSPGQLTLDSVDRQVRNNVLDQWASEFEPELATDRVAAIDQDASSLKFSGFGSDLDGAVHEDLLSRHKLSFGSASGLRS